MKIKRIILLLFAYTFLVFNIAFADWWTIWELFDYDSVSDTYSLSWANITEWTIDDTKFDQTFLDKISTILFGISTNKTTMEDFFTNLSSTTCEYGVESFSITWSINCLSSAPVPTWIEDSTCIIGDSDSLIDTCTFRQATTGIAVFQ